MSIRAMVWAFDQECPSPAAKLVLLKLADHANAEGECWPSQGHIARECGLTRQTVNQQIGALVKLGLVKVEQQFNGSGQMPNRYFLLCRENGHPLSINQTGVSAEATPPLSAEPTPSKPSEVKPSEVTPHTPRKRGAALAGFEEWWKGYPHKVGKGAAERAWPKAIALASAEDLVAGVKRYVLAKPPDREWCHPATWLNQRRWEDQPAASLNGAANRPQGPPPKPEDAWPDLLEEEEMRH